MLAAKPGWPKLRWPAPLPLAAAIADATVPVQRGLITLLFSKTFEAQRPYGRPRAPGPKLTKHPDGGFP
jgi:hypothetical protein